MIESEAIRRGFTVHIEHIGDHDYRATYMPRGLQHVRGADGEPKKVPNYRAMLRASATADVRWDEVPAGNKADLARFDDDARSRVLALHAWVEKLNRLVSSVQNWARELGWSSKVIEKPMDDSTIGSYAAPALLLQQETMRVLLEPIARSTPGSQGVVDLYLMPAYDDIASLYFEGNKWHIRYAKPGDLAGAVITPSDSKPLSKASFRDVLEEMKSHAG